MKALANVQIINRDGMPAFVVIAYEDYMNSLKDNIQDKTIPHEVVALMVDQGMSIFKAWRAYKQLTQQAIAQHMGVAQSAIARIESGKHEPTISTLRAYASALGITIEQLDLSDDSN